MSSSINQSKRAQRIVVSGLLLAATAIAANSATPTAAVASQSVPQVAAVGPSGEAMPVGDRPGWSQIFTDDFTTDVPLGSFPAAVSSKWAVYPSPWKDSSGYGTYSPSKVVDVSSGVLTKDIHTEGGVAMVAAIVPKLPTNSQYGLTYGRFAVRFRTDSVPGYKMAWLLWPDSGDRNHGEIDWPEMNLDSDSIWGFMHRTNPTYSGDQAWFNAPAVLTEWHTTVIEWSPNLVVYFLDGVEVGRTAERVPNTSMHWVLQTETELDLTAPPSAAVRGDVQIDWVAAWAFDASTADTTAPTLTVTAPGAATTVSGAAVTVAATASDGVGVEGVQFKLDGVNLGTDDITAPYEVTWNTFLGSQGAHTISAVARDNAGNTTTESVAVTVSNVADTTPPAVIKLVPQVNGTIWPVAAGIWVGFDEAVTGVSATSFTLKNAATNASVASAVAYKVTTTSVIAALTPTATLLPDTRYTATLTTAIKDAAGNPLAPTTWSFVTGPAPTYTTNPASNAAAVARTANVTATFNESVTGVNAANFALKTAAGAAVAAVVTYNSATRTAILDPVATLSANTIYSATVTTGIKDVVGNPISASSWSFTTGSVAEPGDVDVIKPTVSLSTPVAGAIVTGTVQLGANASDLNGVKEVKWYVDGVQVGYDKGAPWAATWNSDSAADGTHRIFAKACDPTGNWGTSASITVTVDNS